MPLANVARKAASPINRQTRLTGPAPALDRRVNAFRPDLADIGLADQVIAAHYVEPILYSCRSSTAPLRAQPDGAATMVSELLYGETFAVLELTGDWAWGYGSHDHYVGYVPAAALMLTAPPPTHRVTAPSALVFSRADIKSPVTAMLPLGSQVAAGTADSGFHILADGGYIHARHLGPLDAAADDPVAVAETFLGAPYLWGGRTRAGLDCSGLVQAALMACGHACPRDSDQQQEAVGEAVDPSALRRGDIMFFPGHVGLMTDAEHLLHANAFWMRTVIEPLADVVARLKPTHDQPILAAKRL